MHRFKNCIPSRRAAAFGLGYAAVTAVLFFGNSLIHPAKLTLLFLLALSAAAGFALCRWSDRLVPYRQGKHPVLLMLIALYASFASFGYRFFLAGDYMHASAEGFLFLILGFLWFLPVCCLMLILLETAGASLRALPDAPKWSDRRLWAIASAVSFLCLMPALLGYWPGGFPMDSVTQFTQARTMELDDWHPFVHTLMIRFLLKIWNNPGFTVLVQLAFLAALVGRAALLPHRMGIRARWILAGCALFCLLPNQAAVNISPLKDYPFTYAMAWTTLLLIDLVLNPECIRRISFCIQMVLALTLICLMRHNGLVPVFFVMVLLAILTIQHWSLFRLRGIACIAAAAISIGVINGPVASALHVGANGVSPFVTMFCAVGSVINKEKPLPEDVLAALDGVMPLQRWHDYYNKFAGHDDYLWANDEIHTMDLSVFSAGDAFRIYLGALIRYPDIIIKDRMDGMDILWDVVQPEDSFNSRIDNYIAINEAAGFQIPGTEEGDTYVYSSLLARLYSAASYFTIPGEAVHRQVTDMILWRSGAWIIFLMLLFLYWDAHGLNRLWWAAMPLLGNTAASILVVYHQSFRYIWYVQVLTLILLLGTFLCQKSKIGQEKKENG